METAGIGQALEPRSARPARWTSISPAVPLLVLAVLVAALNPVSYVGGGADDWHYLAAAECWASHGACLPHDHWSARWPLIAPMSLALRWGESRAALAAVPFAYALACIMLLAHVAGRLFGRAAGLAAGTLLTLTPAFALSMARPNVDLVELAFLLAALAAWLAAVQRGRPAFAFASGVALCLAVQTRETSLVFVALFGLWFLLSPRSDRRVTWWAAPGFLLPLLAQMLAHAAAAGDPFLRFRLALGHTRIASTELAEHVDRARSPLLNPDFIAGWRPAAGIDAHWTVNPLINLLAHPAIGLTLLAAVVLAAAYGRCDRLSRPSRRGALLLPAAAALGSLVLIYVLAVDPKPRMFMPLAAAAAVTAGAFGAAAWRDGRRLLPLALAFALTANALLILAAERGMGGVEAAASRWIEEADAPLASDETTRRVLALVPEARALPDAHPSRPLHLTAALNGCADAAGPNRRVEREFAFGQDDPPLRHLARRLRGSPEPPSLCLLGPRNSAVAR